MHPLVGCIFQSCSPALRPADLSAGYLFNRFVLHCVPLIRQSDVFLKCVVLLCIPPTTPGELFDCCVRVFDPSVGCVFQTCYLALCPVDYTVGRTLFSTVVCLSLTRQADEFVNHAILVCAPPTRPDALDDCCVRVVDPSVGCDFGHFV